MGLKSVELLFNTTYVIFCSSLIKYTYLTYFISFKLNEIDNG